MSEFKETTSYLKKLYSFCLLNLFLLVFLPTIAMCGVYTPGDPIDYSGSYPRFVPKGDNMYLGLAATDKDKYNGYDAYDNFYYSTNTSVWTVGIPNLLYASPITIYNSNSLTSTFAAQLPTNVLGDYEATYYLNDVASIPENDTGNRNDEEITGTVEITVCDLNLGYEANSTYIENGITYPLIVAPINNDDDNENGINDNL